MVKSIRFSRSAIAFVVSFKRICASVTESIAACAATSTSFAISNFLKAWLAHKKPAVAPAMKLTATMSILIFKAVGYLKSVFIRVYPWLKSFQRVSHLPAHPRPRCRNPRSRPRSEFHFPARATAPASRRLRAATPGISPAATASPAGTRKSRDATKNQTPPTARSPNRWRLT